MKPKQVAKARKSVKRTGATAARLRSGAFFDLTSMNQVATVVRESADARRAARVISEDVIGQPVSV